MEELYRQRIKLQEYQRWLAEFKDISLVLQNLSAEISDAPRYSEKVTDAYIPIYNIAVLRGKLRNKRFPNKYPTVPM